MKNTLIQLTQSISHNLLTRPGNTIIAHMTPHGRQVISVNSDVVKTTLVRYPSTGTIVETIVHKMK